MYSSPDTEQKCDKTGAQDIERATSVRVGSPVDDVATVTEEQGTHLSPLGL